MLVKICKYDEVEEGKPLSVKIDGLPPLAVFKSDGRIFVTDNTCTHGNAMLTEGFQDGLVAECPFHGGSFDIQTGEPLAAPCKVPLKTYVVTIEEGLVYIESKPN